MSIDDLVFDETERISGDDPDNYQRPWSDGECPLEQFSVDVRRAGLIGEGRNSKLLYLALTSRVFDSPVSVVLSGSSGSGKSHLVKRVVEFFPPEAVHQFTSISPKALAYLTDELAHTHLVLAEDDAITGEEQSYFLRTLLSEGRIEHRTVEKQGGLHGKTITIEGPVGAILTSIEGELDRELGTRVLRLPMDESEEQRRAILLSVGAAKGSYAMDAWHAVQRQLADFVLTGGIVEVPFSRGIVEARERLDISPRQLTMVNDLICAYALLKADEAALKSGLVPATLSDYEKVRSLLESALQENAETAVPDAVRSVVSVVRELESEGLDPIRNRDIVDRTDMTAASTSRAVKVATDSGFIVNLDPNPGRPSQLQVGDPLPELTTILPSLDELENTAGVDFAVSR